MSDDQGKTPEELPKPSVEPPKTVHDFARSAQLHNLPPSHTIGDTMFSRMYWKRRQKQLFGTRRNKLNVLAIVATVLFAGIAGCILIVGLLFAWYARDLPRPDKVKRTEGLSTQIFDRNGVNLYDIYEDENRIPVELKDIPQYLRDATIAIEDKSFYTHQGLSTAGILRAMVNIFVFRNFQGGSTLTQQLVKNALLTQERTLPRKIKEAILAIQIERKYTKDEILQMYLNETPYGGTAVGVESAAWHYFNKPVKDLNLVESAMIAGVAQAPSRYSPFTGGEGAYIWRTEQVLRRMREDGYITSTQEDEAKKQLPNLTFATGGEDLKAPHFVAFIRDQLAEKFGEKALTEGGLRVTTTLDWELQKKVQSTVSEEVTKVKYLKVTNGAAVVMDTDTGEILAMVGSRDYSATESGGYKFNVATQGLRQPGSAIKPISYATAFKKGYTPATVLMDVETKYPSGEAGKPDYNPKNYDLKYRGPTQLRYALGNSINTIAVKITALIGVRDVLKTAYDMGISTLEPTDENLKKFGLSVTLGGGEVTLLDLTGAYGVFSQGGVKHEPVSILKVEDSKGKVLYEHKKTEGARVLSEDVSFLISDILSDNGARKAVFGDHSWLVIPGKTVAVKTGTTDDKRDNWTIGYTTHRAVGVWVGNNDNSPMNPALASGVTGAAPIWNRIMKEVLAGAKDEPFKKPDGIVEAEIDALGGGLPVEGQPTRKEYFVKGTEPTSKSPIYQDVKISKHDSSKLANPVEINRGEYDLKTFIVIKEQDPVSTDGKNRWQEGIDAWVAGQSDSRYHPPTDTYSEGDMISVRFKKPGDMERIDSNNIDIRVEAAGGESITKIELFVDGNKVRESGGKDMNDSIAVADGSHELKAVATDSKGNHAEHVIHVGIHQDYHTATSTPAPTPTHTPSPTP